MNENHTKALAHHCRFAFETGQRKFGFIDPERTCSVVLTVNSGWE